jgi:prolyl-tRNA synthetase
MEAVKIYSQFFNELNIPFVISKRPDWDKFAGANCSIAFDTVFPDGRTLQIGTIHDLGQNFSKPFELSYEKKDGTREFAWSTSYGISERAIAAVIALHGDDRGLVLPPKLAPIQVIVVPIPYKGVEEEIYDNSKEVVETLKAAGFRAEIDLRDEVTPGSKFYDWELRGVPIRVEIGPEDVKKGQVTIARRDSLEKVKCPRSELVKTVQDIIVKIEEELKNRAWRWLQEHIQRTENLKEAQKMLAEKRGIIEVPWCGDNDCGLKIEEEADARILGIPLTPEEVSSMKCPICGRAAKTLVRLGKAY